MRTPAERHLTHRLSDHLLAVPLDRDPTLILNIGAGRSTLIEQELMGMGYRFLCDRVDVEDCTADLPVVRNCRQCSVEAMEPLQSGVYSAAFANYVLEHVRDLDRAASEIYRVLKPGGLFVTSVPNLAAPEFVVARHAPERLQRAMTGGKGFHTWYSWSTTDDLVKMFESAGFALEEVAYWSFVEGYLGRYAVIGPLSRFYDRIVLGMRIKRLMGNVCITYRKP
jgi:SAM-dependent methyltransferase